MNDNRVITPQEFANRQDRRASLAELNKMFVRKIKELEDVNRRQAASIKAMNAFLTDLAVTVGTPVPQSAAEGANAIDALRARVMELVDKEKTLIQP